MLFDIHTHTRRYSPCSILSPHDLVKKALELSLDGIVITEHEVLWDEKEILEDLIVAAHSDARRKAEALLQEKMKNVAGGLPLPPGLKLF